jgi:hypothetical protein
MRGNDGSRCRTSRRIPRDLRVAERSAARLAHQSGGLGVPSSNLGAPTITIRTEATIIAAGFTSAQLLALMRDRDSRERVHRRLARRRSACHHARCDGHYEMSDFGAAGEPVHSDGESIESVWPHRRRMVCAGLTEEIMRKPATRDFKASLEVRELELGEDELKKVSGGYIGETEKNISRGKTTF